MSLKLTNNIQSSGQELNLLTFEQNKKIVDLYKSTNDINAIRRQVFLSYSQVSSAINDIEQVKKTVLNLMKLRSILTTGHYKELDSEGNPIYLIEPNTYNQIPSGITELKIKVMEIVNVQFPDLGSGQYDINQIQDLQNSVSYLIDQIIASHYNPNLGESEWDQFVNVINNIDI